MPSPTSTTRHPENRRCPFMPRRSFNNVFVAVNTVPRARGRSVGSRTRPGPLQRTATATSAPVGSRTANCSGTCTGSPANPRRCPARGSPLEALRGGGVPPTAAEHHLRAQHDRPAAWVRSVEHRGGPALPPCPGACGRFARGRLPARAGGARVSEAASCSRPTCACSTGRCRMSGLTSGASGRGCTSPGRRRGRIPHVPD